MPRKLILFFFTFTCICYNLQAETTPWIRVAFGVTKPQGNFAATNFDRKNNGFATDDAGFRAMLGIKISSALSITYEFGGLNSGLNASKVAESINGLYNKSYYYPDQPLKYVTNFNTIGISLHKTFAKNQFEFQLGSRLGISRCDKPSYTLFMDDYVAMVRYIYADDAMSSTAMAYAMDGGIEFKPHPMVQLGMNVAYYQSTHEFSYQANRGGGNIFDFKYRLPVSILWIGVTMRLNIVGN